MESIYEEVLCFELAVLGLKFTRQQGIVVKYQGLRMDLGFRADIIVEDKLILELKSVEMIAPVHSRYCLAICVLPTRN